ncbi:hypothetical protein NL676_034485 [Syzygium grande]|nr:hypothetical protein NL676_034485 [Syzygium grande]
MMGDREKSFPIITTAHCRQLPRFDSPGPSATVSLSVSRTPRYQVYPVKPKSSFREMPQELVCTRKARYDPCPDQLVTPALSGRVPFELWGGGCRFGFQKGR